MSRPPARHKKPPRTHSSAPSRHRKQPPVTPVRQRRPARLAAAAAGTTLLVGGTAATALTHWPGRVPHSAHGLADALRAQGSAALTAAPADGAQMYSHRLRESVAQSVTPRASTHRPQAPLARPVGRHHRPQAAAPPVYANPLRAVAGLLPERIDMGVDFGGSGPIYALGNAVITNATAGSAGWPGGGWITYRLTDGPAAGLSVYVAEDVTPTVQVGQNVSSSTVIANMFDGGAGIETGWAQPDGSSAEAQLPAAGAISGGGPFPTAVGVSFEQLLQAVGVGPANNSGQPAYGILPPNYPTAWTSATLRS